MKGSLRTTIHMYFHIEHTHFRSQHALRQSLDGDFRSQLAHGRSRKVFSDRKTLTIVFRKVIPDRSKVTIVLWKVILNSRTITIVFWRVISDRTKVTIVLWKVILNRRPSRSSSGE